MIITFELFEKQKKMNFEIWFSHSAIFPFMSTMMTIMIEIMKMKLKFQNEFPL